MNLEPASPNASLSLARLVPRGETIMFGLHAAFCDINQLGEFLKLENFSGYVILLDNTGHVGSLGVLLDGRFVVASAEVRTATLWGQAALAEMVGQFSEGYTLETCALEPRLVQCLTGLGEKPLKVAPGEGFTGVRASGRGPVVLLHEGTEIGTLEAQYADTGTFAAPNKAIVLHLPKVVGPWAQSRYQLTLRGRDAVNPITDMHNRLRAMHTKFGLDVLARLGRGQTPVEVANSLEREVSSLEVLVETFLGEGLLQRRPDPV